MPPRRCPTPLCLLAAILLWLTAYPAHALDPSLPPGGNFDLTHWYLGLPVDSSGGTSGDSASITAAQLVAGYSNALYFYTGADGAMTFWAPVTGATTPGSSYPRSELREQIVPGNNNINWSGYGMHTLDAQCRVIEVASTKKVIIGQIHTKTGEARPLVKLQYNDGTIEALIKNSPTADPDSKYTFSNVGLSNLVTYRIRMVDGLVTVTVNGSSRSHNAFATDPDWANQEFYFKAGSYCQDNVGTASEGARVAFYSLIASHNAVTNTPPTFTSDPINKPNATVAVAYDGSLAGDATDPDAGEILTFSKAGGPTWLNVAGDGTLSGTPGAGDVGTNSWTVWVADLASASNQAVLNIIVSAVSTGGPVTNVIVDDSFADGNRAATGPLQANWWSSSSTSGNSIEASVGTLGLVSGTSGRGIHGTFAPQTLAVGDALVVTYSFTTPATVGNNLGSSFKVALMDFNNPGLAADLLSSSGSVNPLYTNLPGYMVDFDVNTGAAADTSFREHDVNTLGRFLGTTTEWTQMSTSPDEGYAFAANTGYVGVFSVKRTGADSIELFSSLSQGATLLTSHTDTDSSGIANNFGMFGVWANSGVFGTSNVAGNPDNGIDFSNIKIELVLPAPADPPTLDIALSGGNVVLSWPTSGSAGFGLESTASLNPAGWSGAGSPTVIGDRNYVTNSLAGNAQLYRLRK